MQSATPAAIEAFQSFYLSELDNRIKRSEVVGSIALKKSSAALFYEPAEHKFTLVEKMNDVEEANVFDCVTREQWGRTAMVFGHATNTGGYIPSGHATLDQDSIKIKLASGRYYHIAVDPTLPYLQPFVSAEPTKPREESSRSPKRGNSRNKNRSAGVLQQSEQPHSVPKEMMGSHPENDDQNEDLTEEDLRRLRGEIPLTKNSKKKWKR